jgi:hypothetical protein
MPRRQVELSLKGKGEKRLFLVAPENTLSYKRGILRGDEKEPLFTLPLQRQFHLSSGHPAGTPAMYKCYLSCNYLGFYLLKTGVNIIGRAPRLDN